MILIVIDGVNNFIRSFEPLLERERGTVMRGYKWQGGLMNGGKGEIQVGAAGFQTLTIGWAVRRPTAGPPERPVLILIL